MTLPRTAESVERVASLRTRTGGYVVDMVIFAAVTLVLTVLAGTFLLFSTDWAEQDASDAQFYTFLGIIGIGVPLVWSVMNIVLLQARGQTGGQYVAGVKLRSEEGGKVLGREAVTWWFCFNPLLFSWPMALAAGFPLALVFFLIIDRFALIAFGVIITLCIACPIVALISALADRGHRALHDRIARVVVVPVE